MNKDFVPYNESLELKELGFDEPCLAVHYPNKFYFYSKNRGIKNSNKISQSWICTAPTFSQAFRWFREKYRTYSTIIYRVSMEDDNEYWDWLIKGEEVVYRHFNTYEEAELACLQKLIQIVKK
jgi:hypothetical protein